MTSSPFRVVRCENCQHRAKRVIDVQVAGGKTVEVGRCSRCDAATCRNCEGRTFDPVAKTCNHCGHSIAMLAS